MANILIVDDSKSMRQMIEMTLIDQGHNVVSAEDGLEALEKSEDLNFDVVVTDINMPRMNGLELIEALRKKTKYATTPILCLTTESGSDIKTQGKNAGATGWIVKPFEPEKLIKTIGRVI